ncbi:MAG: hypothetical protein AAFY26_06375 [Cyanobacteria bacterium J06638_22]
MQSPHPSVECDPLNSPFPIPWAWVMDMLAQSPQPSQLYYFRSPTLPSPDGRHVAYSRIHLRVGNTPLITSQVSSALFVENLETEDIHAIPIHAPFANNPFIRDAELESAGTIAIAIPVSWSRAGDRLLIREFESLFSSNLASDFAVIWDGATQQAYTIAPSGFPYSHAVLLGWSGDRPDQALFEAGMIGESDAQRWRVDCQGRTMAAPTDQPTIFGWNLHQSAS